MIDLSPEITAIIMLGGILIGILIGYPLAFSVGAVGIVVGTALFGFDQALELMYCRLFSILTSYTLAAIPLFVFMGTMLERAGIADKLFSVMYLWLSWLRGGLAIITVLTGTILAACVGTVGASVTMLTLIALPSMMKRGYNKSLACGTVCAAGGLGVLIPPSVLMVVYGEMAGLSVGKLFMAGIGPGLLLAGLYVTYIFLRSSLKPEVAPTRFIEEQKVTLAKKTVMLFTGLVPTAAIILAVLGSIFFGIAPPTEAAGIGAFASLMLTIAYRKFSWRLLQSAALATLKTAGMIFLIAGLSYSFTGVFLTAGCGTTIRDIIVNMPFGRWGAFVMIMLILFILGIFIDIIGIVFITVPIITPIASDLGFHALWFALMMIVNLQMAYMTPPMALSIFYLRGTADPNLGVTVSDAALGVIPFVLLVMVVLGLLVAFPEIVVWLPTVTIK